MSHPREGRVAILRVGVGSVEFGINLVHVRAVTRPSSSRPLPEGPPYLTDFIELGGQAIGVLDLAARLGEAPALPASDRKLVVTHDDRFPIALAVDRVSDPEEVPFAAVTRLGRTETSSAGEEAEAGAAPVAVEALVFTPRGSLPILNPQHLLSRDLRRRLPALLEAARASA